MVRGDVEVDMVLVRCAQLVLVVVKFVVERQCRMVRVFLEGHHLDSGR